MTTPKTRPTIVLGESHAYPVLPLRDIVVFPHMIVPLFVGRDKSVAALEAAMADDKMIFLVAQLDPANDDPGRDDPGEGEGMREARRRVLEASERLRGRTGGELRPSGGVVHRSHCRSGAGLRQARTPAIRDAGQYSRQSYWPMRLILI